MEITAVITEVLSPRDNNPVFGVLLLGDKTSSIGVLSLVRDKVSINGVLSLRNNNQFSRCYFWAIKPHLFGFDL